MNHSLSSLLRPASLRVSPRSPQAILLQPISVQNPNHSTQRLLLLLSHRISNADHLRQLFCRAIIFGIHIQNPHLHLLNALLHSLAGGPTPSLALILFDLIHSQSLAIDSYTFTSALKATSRLSQPYIGANIHSLVIKLGLESDMFVFNSLIHMYSASNLVSNSRRVFDLAPDSTRDIVSWNSMIFGYLQNGLYEECLCVFGKMVENLIPMDASTLVGVLSACGKIGALNLGRRIHSFTVTRGVDVDFYLGSSLISMYAKCGAVDHARKLFDKLPDKNVVCWTSMISCYAHANQFFKTMELFREMQADDVMPDDGTVASVLSSCAQLGALDQGKYIHAYCHINGIGLGLLVKNALIDMYSKCGDINKALHIFHELDNPDVFSWTTMISGLAMNGNSFGALELFSKMEVSRVVIPNEVTFLGVLSACSHGGLIEQGRYYFDLMRRIYKLLPRLEHYGCMVDLLGRAKLMIEAEKFIKDMPIEPDVVIWRSLLFACRVNGDYTMAEFAARRIMELEPKRCGGHVMLSNVYAVASKWTDVNRVRRIMNYSSLQKQPGCSFIELNGVLHEFLAANKLYCQEEIVYEVLISIHNHSTDN